MGSYNLPPDIADSFKALEKRVAVLERGPLTARASVKRTTNQSIASFAVGVPVVFDTATFNVGGLWNPAQTSRLTIPAGAPLSIYIIFAQLRFTAGSAAGVCQVDAQRNGGVVPELVAEGIHSFGISESFTVSLSRPIVAAGGDYWEVVIGNTSTQPITMTAGILSLVALP